MNRPNNLQGTRNKQANRRRRKRRQQGIAEAHAYISESEPDSDDEADRFEDAADVEVQEAIPNNAGIALEEDPAGVEEGDNAYPRSEDESDDLVEQSSDDEFDDAFDDFGDSVSEISDDDAHSEASEGSSDSRASEDSEQEGSDAESSEDEGGDFDANQPIYEGAPLSLHESMLAIFTVFYKENMTFKLLSVILQLICLHCPDGCILKRTLVSFRKYFAKLGDSILIYHYYCSNCSYPLKSKESKCPNPKCVDAGEHSFFLEIPLLHQLQVLFKRENFFQDLQFRFKPNRKRERDNIEDIYDGRIYKDQVANNGFLSNPCNISFMWYSDGVKVFKSSKFSIWPLCLVINELSYKNRTQPQNILMVGLWFGKKQPSPNVFLRPFSKTSSKFERDGHTFTLHNNAQVHVRGKILCGTCDLPAKSKFLNFKQFNSLFGCSRCLAEGGRASVNKTTVQVYPYRVNVPDRNHEETIEFGQQALRARITDRKASVNGVKGPTLLSKMVPDIIKCTAIDILHGIFLGVCKKMAELWFSSKYSTQPWSLSHLVDVVEERLQKLKSPSSAQRAPRSLKDLALWKGADYKFFFFYYFPILKGLLDDAYLRHHCCLVSAVYLLNQESISLAQVEAASVLLKSYVSDFARLYPLRFLGINVHQLLHLCTCVLDIGPLWVFCCFFLESFNGQLNKLFHGTQHVALQICSSVTMFMQVPTLINKLRRDSRAFVFCQKIQNSAKPVKIADVIDELTFAVGVYSRDRLRIQSSRLILRQSLNVVNGNLNLFYRLKKKGIIYYAKEYSRVSKRKESSYVSFYHGDVLQLGRIVRFVRWSDCGNLCDWYCTNNCPVSYFLIVNIYSRHMWFAHEFPGVRLSYMSKVKPTDEIVAVTVESLNTLCFYVEVDDDEYIGTPINRLEIE